jgi:hypothetical protein
MVKLFRIIINIQIIQVNEIKDLMVRVDVINRVTIYFTQKFDMVWITLEIPILFNDCTHDFSTELLNIFLCVLKEIVLSSL